MQLHEVRFMTPSPRKMLNSKEMGVVNSGCDRIDNNITRDVERMVVGNLVHLITPFRFCQPEVSQNDYKK